MRQNLPVSRQEFDFPANATLMSTTDTHSRITYANAAFMAVSGFERDELLGQPHNVVRHPDMPAQAFADMWATLKAGRSWTALVKNRRKNGDHYWVRANAAPINHDGRITGYMSVRTRPARAEVDAAETLYRKFREGRAGHRRFHQGLVVRTGWLAWTSLHQVLPARWRIRLGILGLGAGFLGCAAAAGLAGMALADVAAATAALAGAASAFIELQISRPLEHVLRQALSVAAGQPGEIVQFDRVDEVGMILRAVNQAGLNLRSLVDDVSEQVGGVQNASMDISRGNSSLSERTEQTASNLEETASSMEQMNTTVRNNADTARQAAQLANGAADAAATGGAVVGQVVDTMQEITRSSKRIADIIGVIDGIAFQTNILALNAAVEAARAGEQGRGFAVVATEVRHLAQRSADAAREIKNLIGSSVANVENGAQQVDQAGRAMHQIIEQVGRVNALIAAISDATLEQSSGISHVNSAVSQLDRMTQQNAGLVEQSAAAAEALNDQARRLAESVEVFKRGIDAQRHASGANAVTAANPGHA